MDEKDASPDYVSWLNDTEVNKFLDTKSSSIDEQARYINIKNAQADSLLLGIFTNENKRHVGTIKLEPIDVQNGQATIAVMLGDKSAWGKGLGGEAMRLLIDYGKKKLFIKKINLGVRSENITAIKSYEKLGFIEIKRTPQLMPHGSNSYENVLMALDVSNNSEIYETMQ